MTKTTDEAGPLGNIYEKIAAIQAEMPRLKKDGEMDLGGAKKLKFLEIDAILDAVKPLLDRYKVIVLPNERVVKNEIKYGQEPPSDVDPSKWSGRITTKSVQTLATYDFTWIDTEHPESTYTVTFTGEAMDTQDKSTGKALTSCQKSMYIKVLNIITGDPEIESENPDKEPAEEKKDRGAQQRESARSGGTTTTKKTATTNPRPAARRAAEKAAEEAADAAVPAEEPEAPAEEAPAEAPEETFTPDAADVEHAEKVADPPAAEPKLETTPQADKLRDAKVRLSKENMRYGEILGKKGEGDRPALGLEKAEIDDLALEVTGKTRDKWITLPTALNKIADAIKKMADEAEAAADAD